MRELMTPSSPDREWDRTVRARLVAGDAAALADCYGQLGAYVFGLAVRILRDRGRAQDITQDVFCFLWERPDSFDPDRSSLRSFVGMLAHRRSVDLVRRLEASKRREHAYGSLADTIPSSVVESVQAGMAAERVRRAVDQLPDEQRLAVMLAYFRGRTFKEVAEILGIPEGTAKSRIRLALGRLSRSLNAAGVTR